MTVQQLFSNPSVGNFVTVDLDVWLEFFLRKQENIPEDEKPGVTIGYIREQIIQLEAKLDQPITAQYRRSSNGHVHLRLIFPQEITVADAFLLRQCLFDDHVRLFLDMKRYALWGSLHELNKCFDTKADGGKITKAGPWIPLERDLEDFQGAELEDWHTYWDSIGRHPHKASNHEKLIYEHFTHLPTDMKEDAIRELQKRLKEEKEQLCLINPQATTDLGFI